YRETKLPLVLLHLAMITLFIISVFVILLTTWLLQYYKYEKYWKKIKGPRPWPFVGNALQLGTTTDVLPTLLDNQKKYGELFKIYLGFAPPLLVISNPQFLEFLLGSTKILEKASNYRFLHRWLGKGLLTSESKYSILLQLAD
ncbi:hypothetical protein ILUMI_14336, partial [Ignelater luminosus]